MGRHLLMALDGPLADQTFAVSPGAAEVVLLLGADGTAHAYTVRCQIEDHEWEDGDDVPCLRYLNNELPAMHYLGELPEADTDPSG